MKNRKVRVQQLINVEVNDGLLSFFSRDGELEIKYSELSKAIKVPVPELKFPPTTGDLSWIRSYVKIGLIELPLWIRAKKAIEFCEWFQRLIDESIEVHESQNGEVEMEFVRQFEDIIF